jgi:hypothetical protein
LAALGGTAVGASAAAAEEGPQEQEQDEADSKGSHKDGEIGDAIGQHLDARAETAVNCSRDQSIPK